MEASSHTRRPIMALLDLLGQRWVLRILWELRDDRPLSFRALQEACGGLSPSVLNDRLKALKAAEIVALTPNGFVLAPQGRDLGQHLEGLNAWAKRWVNPNELNG